MCVCVCFVFFFVCVLFCTVCLFEFAFCFSFLFFFFFSFLFFFSVSQWGFFLSFIVSVLFFFLFICLCFFRSQCLRSFLSSVNHAGLGLTDQPLTGDETIGNLQSLMRTAMVSAVAVDPFQTHLSGFLPDSSAHLDERSIYKACVEQAGLA